MAPTKRTKRPIDSLATTAISVNTSSPSSAAAASAPGIPPPFAAAVTKRRVVPLAEDADVVLAKCRKLRDELRRKQALQVVKNDDDGEELSDLEWGMNYGSDSDKGKGITAAATVADAEETKKTKTQQLSLSELRKMTSANDGKKTIVEVVEMNSTEVMEGIENVAVHIAQQVLAKQGFQLAIPCMC
jgi:hypothetical protein